MAKTLRKFSKNKSSRKNKGKQKTQKKRKTKGRKTACKKVRRCKRGGDVRIVAPYRGDNNGC